jgi:hypothetical protein
MSRRIWIGLQVGFAVGLALLVLGMAAPPVQALEIDDFSDDFDILVWPEFQYGGASIFPSPGTLTVTGSMVGSELDVVATSPEGYLRVTAASGEFSHDVDPGDAGTTELTWDGADGDPDALDPIGLGVDLKEGGADGFLIDVTKVTSGTILAISVYTQSTNTSESLIITETGVIEIPFENFSDSSFFSNVGAIKLTVTSTSGHDITIANFKTGVTTPPTAVKGLALRATGTSFPLLAGLLGTTAVVVSTHRKRQD